MVGDVAGEGGNHASPRRGQLDVKRHRQELTSIGGKQQSHDSHGLAAEQKDATTPMRKSFARKRPRGEEPHPAKEERAQVSHVSPKTELNFRQPRPQAPQTPTGSPPPRQPPLRSQLPRTPSEAPPRGTAAQSATGVLHDGASAPPEASTPTVKEASETKVDDTPSPTRKGMRLFPFVRTRASASPAGEGPIKVEGGKTEEAMVEQSMEEKAIVEGEDVLGDFPDRLANRRPMSIESRRATLCTPPSSHEAVLVAKLLEEKCELQLDMSDLEKRYADLEDALESERKQRLNKEEMVEGLRRDVLTLVEEKMALVDQLNKRLRLEKRSAKLQDVAMENEAKLEKQLAASNATNEELLTMMNKQLFELHCLSNLNRDLVDKVDAMKEVERENRALTEQIAMFAQLVNDTEQRCNDMQRDLAQLTPVVAEKDALVEQLNQILYDHDRELRLCSDNYATFKRLGPNSRVAASIEYLKRGEAVFHGIRTPDEKSALLRAAIGTDNPDAVLRVVLFLRETLSDRLFYPILINAPDKVATDMYLAHLRAAQKWEDTGGQLCATLRALDRLVEEGMQCLREALAVDDPHLRKRRLEWCLSFCLEHHSYFDSFYLETIKHVVKKQVARANSEIEEVNQYTVDVEAYLDGGAEGSTEIPHLSQELLLSGDNESPLVVKDVSSTKPSSSTASKGGTVLKEMRRVFSKGERELPPKDSM